MVDEKLNQMYKVLQMMFEFFEDKHYDRDDRGYPTELSDFYHAMNDLEKMMKPVTITTEMVRQLREETGEGMMNCHKALKLACGDMSKAKNYLR